MIEKNTCYKCKNRTVGCHSNCNTYKQYKKYLAAIKENKNRERSRFTTHK